MRRLEWTRRRWLGAIGAVGTAAVAGCERPDGDGGTPSDGPSETASPSGTETGGEQVAVATEAATVVAEWRQARTETATRLASAETMRRGTDEERQQFLLEAGSDLSEAVYRVHYVNLDTGDIVASTSEAEVGERLNTREAPWQNESVAYGEDGVFVANAVEALIMSLLSVVAPVETDDDGEFVIVVQANLDELGRELPHPDGTDEAPGFTRIVDEESRVVSDSQSVERLSRNDGTLSVYEAGAGAPAVQRGLSGESGTVTQTRSDGDEQRAYRVGFAPVAGVEWVAITHAPVEGDSDRGRT